MYWVFLGKSEDVTNLEEMLQMCQVSIMVTTQSHSKTMKIYLMNVFASIEEYFNSLCNVLAGPIRRQGPGNSRHE